MQSRMDEFREFVARYPKLRDEVRSGKRTWQNIYEEWVLYGEGDQQWNNYRNLSEDQNQKPNQTPTLNDSVKTIVSYIQKINPDSLNRTLNTVQKVVQIAQTLGPKRGVSSLIGSTYNDWWD